ncbi:MAG: hypothetical protein QOE61_3797 [Micromonosporaceae bacterium]|nr:hypothetical protein [Micromonosporaceae bacterium]
MQSPATATLTGGGVRANFMTWHAPRGPGQVLQAATLQGGANPDAYLFLQNSTVYGGLTAPGVGNLGQAGQPAPTFPLNLAGNYQVPSSPHAILYGQSNW